MAYEDILFEKQDGRANITINRPDRYNAFRGQTITELNDAFHDAWTDDTIGVVVLTGAGEKAFCSGGDQKARFEEGGYGGGKRSLQADMGVLHHVIRGMPKPVIARVNGYAIGGGNVLQVLCDLSIACESAILGQVGPSMGSVDPGWGTAYLSRLVGERKAREIWYLCRRYSGKQAEAMGLVNVCVPDDQLDAEVDKWCNEILDKSPTALALAKLSFNADTENIGGISGMGFEALGLYYQTGEAAEGLNAFVEKRDVDFRKFRQ